MDIERLKTDIDYWNEIAPENATHYNIAAGWSWLTSAGWLHCYDSEIDGWKELSNSTTALLRLNTSFPKPKPKPKWDGNGLPTAGTVCFVQNTMEEYVRCTIDYIGKSYCIYTDDNGYESINPIHDDLFITVDEYEKRQAEKRAISEIAEMIIAGMIDNGTPHILERRNLNAVNLATKIYNEFLVK